MNENWPQQEAFCQMVKDFCKKHGYLTSRGAVQLGVVSRLFHVSEDTLRQYLQYKSKSRPNYDRLAHIASVIGVSVNVFTGFAGESPPNIAQEKWNKISDRARTFAATVFQDVLSDDLTNGELEELFIAYREAKERLLRMKQMWRSIK